MAPDREDRFVDDGEGLVLDLPNVRDREDDDEDDEATQDRRPPA